jgi:hypothetical protein
MPQVIKKINDITPQATAASPLLSIALMQDISDVMQAVYKTYFIVDPLSFCEEACLPCNVHLSMLACRHIPKADRPPYEAESLGILLLFRHTSPQVVLIRALPRMLQSLKTSLQGGASYSSCDG